MSILSAPSDVEKVCSEFNCFLGSSVFDYFRENFGCAKDHKNLFFVAPLQLLMSSRMSILLALSEPEKVVLLIFNDAKFACFWGTP